MGVIDINKLGDFAEIAKQIDAEDSLHEKDDGTKGDNTLSTSAEINAFYDYLRQVNPELANVSNEELAKEFEDITPDTFDCIMNPESWVINKIAGCNSDNVDGYFKSYLNPLTPYSHDKNVGTMERWTDPLMTTIDTNIGKGEEKHFGYLNPIHSFSSNKKDVAGITKGESILDPGMCAATSFIKNEKTAKVVRGILNPISLIGRLWS